MTFEERKALADLKYDLEVAFLHNDKRLNNTQRHTLKRTIDTLGTLLDNNTQELMTNGKMGDYFKQIYGINV